MNRNGFWLMLLLQTVLLLGKVFSFIDIGWGMTFLPVMIYAGGFILIYLCLLIGRGIRRGKIKKEG